MKNNKKLFGKRILAGFLCILLMAICAIPTETQIYAVDNNSMEFTGFALPQEGETYAVPTISCEDYEYPISSVEAGWKVSNDIESANVTSFEAGQTYYFFMDVYAGLLDGHYFKSDVPYRYLNGLDGLTINTPMLMMRDSDTSSYKYLQISGSYTVGHAALTHYDQNAATALADGNIEYYYCSTCGKYYSDSACTSELSAAEVIVPKHILSKIDKVDATCCAVGYVEYYTCKDCSLLFTDSTGTATISAEAIVIPMAAHNLKKHEAKKACAGQPGNSEYYECENSYCKKLFLDPAGSTLTTAEAVITTAEKHVLTKIEAVEETDTEDGCKEYYQCSICGGLFADAAGTTSTTMEELVVPKNVLSGPCGPAATYTFNKVTGVMTIEGTGRIDFYGADYMVYNTVDKSSIKKVIIDEGITAIGRNCFYSTISLQEIQLPQTLQTIEEFAFIYAKLLTEVQIPANVSEIQEYAFENAVSKRIVVDPANEYYSSEDGVLFNKAKTILIAAPLDFAASYTIPSTVKTISAYAFFYNNIQELILPDGLEDIESNALAFTGLTELVIPASVKSISTIQNMNLRSYQVAEENETFCSVDGVLYTKDMKTLISYPAKRTGDYRIPDTVTNIRASALSYANIGELVVPASVEFSSTSNHICWECTIDRVILQEGIKAFRLSEFSSTIDEMYLPKSLESFYTDLISFPSVVQWNRVIFAGSADSWANIAKQALKRQDSGGYVPVTFLLLKDGSCGPTARYELDRDGVLTITGTGVVSDYEDKSTYTTAPWVGDAGKNLSKISKIVVENGITQIGANAFAYHKEVSDVVLPASLKTINDGAFANSTSIKYIFFGGLKNQYSSITKGTGNDSIGEVCVHYIARDHTLATERVDATCKNEGRIIDACTAEGCDYGTVTFLEKVDHNYQQTAETPATCTENGKATYTCSYGCGATYDKVLEAPGHKIVVDAETPATCTKKGMSAGSHCENCGEVITAQKEIPALGHAYTNRVVKQATQTADGTLEKTCDRCGIVESSTKIYKASTVKLGTSVSSFYYTGKALKPAITVRTSKGADISSKYYTLTYSNNTDVGTATVLVRFKDRYKGKVSVTFRIIPKRTQITSISSMKKGFAVKWDVQKVQTSGYQIQYSEAKNFSGKTTKVVTVSGKTTAKTTVKNLKSATKYYVRIRTYKTVSNVKYCSSWSKAVSVVKTK